MIYIVQLTVEVAEDSREAAHTVIRAALDGAKLAEIVLTDLTDRGEREED